MPLLLLEQKKSMPVDSGYEERFVLQFLNKPFHWVNNQIDLTEGKQLVFQFCDQTLILLLWNDDQKCAGEAVESAKKQSECEGRHETRL